MNTVLITGIGGNLGRAAAEEFIQRGFNVVGIDVHKRDDPFYNHKNIIAYLSLDLLKEEEVGNAIMDIHVTNPINSALMIAGGFGVGSFAETDMAEIQKMIDLNFKTAHHVSRTLFSAFKENGGKMIFVTAKPAVEPGGSFATAYSISKNMLIKLADIINEEGKKYQISATAIAPEIIDTPINRKAMPDADYSSWLSPAEIAQNIAHLCTAGKVIKENVIRLYNKK